MKKGEKKKLNKIAILSAGIIVGTLIVGSVFIYLPFLNRNKSLRAQILQERDKNALTGEIRALGRHLRVYEKMVLEEAGVSWLLRMVSDMASQEQLEVSSIRPDAPEDWDLYTRIYVTMDVVSTYHRLGRFISRVESSEKFLKVESINIKRLDLDGELDRAATKFKDFDVKGHIVISAVVSKE